MNDKILRELRALKVYSFILTIAIIAVTVMSFTGGTQKQVFTEIAKHKKLPHVKYGENRHLIVVDFKCSSKQNRRYIEICAPIELQSTLSCLLGLSSVVEFKVQNLLTKVDRLKIRDAVFSTGPSYLLNLHINPSLMV